jgi:hypothetical protein
MSFAVGRRSVPGLLAGVMSLSLLACGNGGADAPEEPPASGRPEQATIKSVPQALRGGDGPMAVRGYVLISPRGDARICEGLLGSYPPQCGGASLAVEGLDPETLPGRQMEQGMVWTGETVVRGVMRGQIFTATP